MHGKVLPAQLHGFQPHVDQHLGAKVGGDAHRMARFKHHIDHRVARGNHNVAGG
ncbi:hypothetical protein SDC9_97078 [bioreactor metagenome]|uniref:Uncharacterized protein n=1 Tax=bioreactor metagenome TaxID=1076179 RepID=A0A645AAU4_9ZZZZ